MNSLGKYFTRAHFTDEMNFEKKNKENKIHIKIIKKKTKNRKIKDSFYILQTKTTLQSFYRKKIIKKEKNAQNGK